MWEQKRIPIGVEDFAEMRKKNLYLVDKTNLIQDLLQTEMKVTLFTRPRRFGKTLNMSMLKAFFEVGCEPALFDGMNIKANKKLCEQYMGKFPVISISLKGIEGLNFEEAFQSFVNAIGEEATRFKYLLKSEKLDAQEKEKYSKLIQVGTRTMFDMSLDTLESSLKVLSELLSKHYGQNAIILIDEYDVPLDKASQGGYYVPMVNLIRKMFHNALKTNPYLQFSVLTGCLRVSKESIFTGLNNLSVVSITYSSFSEYFGFTDEEVKALLSYYNLAEYYGSVKEWYDGYRFGETNLYCPWDVMSYCGELVQLRAKQPNGFVKPRNYWVNTSSNAIVKSLLKKAKVQTKREMEQLIAGEVIEKKINETLTYAEMNESIDHIWSVMFSTGYLTCDGMTEHGYYRLRIPNQEVRSIFVEQVM
ncbi:MAG: AAA family ATPase, partial [Lachnospiraceae bacterium]